jgi:hypothetical protein
MNIPSPAITTTEITPQDVNHTNITTTMTLPVGSSHLIGPLIEFRNRNNNFNGKDQHGKSDGGTMGTCMAMADLTSALFELFNDTAFAGVVDGKSDEDGGDTAFLGFIGAARPKTQVKDDSKIVVRLAPRNALLRASRRIAMKSTPNTLRTHKEEDEDRDAPSCEDNRTKMEGGIHQTPSHASISNRVKKVFRTSPLERPRRSNIVLQAMRRSENGEAYLSDPSGYTNIVLTTLRRSRKEEESYLSDTSEYTLDNDESGLSYSASQGTSTGEAIEGTFINTNETDLLADDERTPDSTIGDDALRDGVDTVDVDKNVEHQVLLDAFPTVTQNVHSLRTGKSPISQQNKQWLQLQFPSESNEFHTFEKDTKNLSFSSLDPRTEEESFKSYRDAAASDPPPSPPSADQLAKDEGTVSTRPIPADPVTVLDMRIPPLCINDWIRNSVEDREEESFASYSDATALVCEDQLVNAYAVSMVLPPFSFHGYGTYNSISTKENETKSLHIQATSPGNWIRQQKMDVKDEKETCKSNGDVPDAATHRNKVEKDEREGVGSTKPTSVDPVTVPEMRTASASPTSDWIRENFNALDSEEHLISTCTIKKMKSFSRDKVGNGTESVPESFIPSTHKRSWRATVRQQISCHEDMAPIPLTPERMMQVEENKNRVQRNFQWRVKHHHARMMRQRIANRTVGPMTATD